MAGAALYKVPSAVLWHAVVACFLHLCAFCKTCTFLLCRWSCRSIVCPCSWWRGSLALCGVGSRRAWLQESRWAAVGLPASAAGGAGRPVTCLVLSTAWRPPPAEDGAQPQACDLPGGGETLPEGEMPRRAHPDWPGAPKLLTFILPRSCSSTARGLVKAHLCSGRRTQHPGVLQNIRAGKCGQPGSWHRALQRVPKPRADALLQAAVIAAAGRGGVRSITTKRRALVPAIIAFRTLRGVSLWAVCICSVTQSAGVIPHPAGASQELQPCSALRPRAVRSAAQVMIASLGGFLWFQKPKQPATIQNPGRGRL